MLTRPLMGYIKEKMDTAMTYVNRIRGLSKRPASSSGNGLPADSEVQDLTLDADEPEAPSGDKPEAPSRSTSYVRYRKPEPRRTPINGNPASSSRSTRVRSDGADVPLGAASKRLRGTRQNGISRRASRSSSVTPSFPIPLTGSRGSAVVDVDDGTAASLEPAESHRAESERSRRQSTRCKKPRTDATFNSDQVRRDRQKREGQPKRVSSHADLPRIPRCEKRGAQSETIILDDEEDNAVEETRPTTRRSARVDSKGRREPEFPESKPTTNSATRQDREVVLGLEKKGASQKEAADELKDLELVEATYTGPTDLIFMYPPGGRGKITVTEEERERLKRRKYLNDSLIDFYLKYLETEVNGRPPAMAWKSKFFSSFFFGVLRREKPIDYLGVKGWTKGIDLFSTSFVFVPICDSYHWSLIIVANLEALKGVLEKQNGDQRSAAAECLARNPKIIYLDSLDPKRGTEFGDTMRHYLVEEWLCRKQGKAADNELRRQTYRQFRRAIPTFNPNVPIQSNEYDCGLYLLNSLEMFVNNTDDFLMKMLHGVKDVRSIYNHVDIQTLRKEILFLMEVLQQDWKRNHDGPGGAAVPEATFSKGEDAVEEMTARVETGPELGHAYENDDRKVSPQHGDDDAESGGTHECVEAERDTKNGERQDNIMNWEPASDPQFANDKEGEVVGGNELIADQPDNMEIEVSQVGTGAQGVGEVLEINSMQDIEVGKDLSLRDEGEEAHDDLDEGCHQPVDVSHNKDTLLDCSIGKGAGGELVARERWLGFQANGSVSGGEANPDAVARQQVGGDEGSASQSSGQDSGEVDISEVKAGQERSDNMRSQGSKGRKRRRGPATTQNWAGYEDEEAGRHAPARGYGGGGGERGMFSNVRSGSEGYKNIAGEGSANFGVHSWERNETTIAEGAYEDLKDADISDEGQEPVITVDSIYGKKDVVEGSDGVN